MGTTTKSKGRFPHFNACRFIDSVVRRAGPMTAAFFGIANVKLGKKAVGLVVVPNFRSVLAFEMANFIISDDKNLVVLTKEISHHKAGSCIKE